MAWMLAYLTIGLSWVIGARWYLRKTRADTERQQTLWEQDRRHRQREDFIKTHRVKDARPSHRG